MVVSEQLVALPMKAKSNGHNSNTAGPRRAAIYRRVSSEVQGERVSPEVQLSDSEQQARAHGYVVVGVYSDIERYRVRGRLVEPSGSRVDRPAFVRMLADGRAGKFDLIIAWKEDRLYRGVHPAVMVDDLIEDSGVTVELVKETFDRKMLFIKAAIGRMELDSIRERTTMGHRERVRGGLIHGGPVPAGYVAVRTTDDAAAVGYTLDPAWRGFFDNLARYYLARLPMAEIARNLGADPRTGHPWQDTMIGYILRNPFYRGKLAYGWQSGNPDFTVKANHAAAWDDATCTAIERELLRRGGRHNAPRGRGLLSGILRCGICGAEMACGNTTQKHEDGTVRHQYRYYGCGRPVAVRTGRWHGRPTHGPNFINERKALGLIRAMLAGIQPDQVDVYLSSIAMSLGGPAPDDGERGERLEAEAEKLKARLADLTVGLNGVRNESPAATEAIIAAITAAGKQLDRVRAEADELDGRRAGSPDLAGARAAMLRLIAEPQLFDRPGDVTLPGTRVAGLQGLLRDAFPALFIAAGKIAEPVRMWEE